MKRRTLTTLILFVFAASLAATGEQTARAMVLGGRQKEKATTKVAPKITVKPHIDLDVDPQVTPTAPGQVGKVSLKLERGGKVIVSNRNGLIRITGWDGEMVEASAEGEEGPEAVQVRVTGDAPRSRVVLSVPAIGGRGHNREINLDIKLPRYADLESIESFRGDIDITGIDGTVSVSTN